MYFEYFKYILIHKWYVFTECVKYGIIWRGVVHDLSKFMPGEFIPYARHFNGNHPPTKDMQTKNYCKPVNTGDPEFDEAWCSHIKKNKHHWQWWVVPELGNGVKTIEIDDVYRTEMLCDWLGACKISHTNIKEWWSANRDKLQIHENTRMYVDNFVNKI